MRPYDCIFHDIHNISGYFTSSLAIMKGISAFISVILSSLSLLAPTDALPVDSMVARALPNPVSASTAKAYLAARGYMVNYSSSDVNHTLVVTIKPDSNGDT